MYVLCFYQRVNQIPFLFLNLRWVVPALLFTAYSSVSAGDISLISVVTSANGNVSYVNVSPLHYTAKKKDFSLIQISPKSSINNKKQEKLRPMQLTIYTTCNRRASNPEIDLALGFRSQVLSVYFLLSPHPDEPAVYYLSLRGLFRILKEAIKKTPYFQEKGTIKITGTQHKPWKVNIQHPGVTYNNPKPYYFIKFSEQASQNSFIQALKLAATPIKNSHTPQVTILLESPSFNVKATYALIHKGHRQYQVMKSMNIIEWWSKQQEWCPNSPHD